MPTKAKGEKDIGDRATVWVLDGNFVRPVGIQTGLTDGVQTEVIAGELNVGDLIVIGARRAAKGDDAANPFTPKIFGGAKKSG
jgi:HlyD family secretion protein